jgi:transposase-like protein
MEESIHHNSSHFAAISDAGLSPVQAQIIEALAQGQTVSAAAEKAGVHRTTIHHWIRNQPQFKAAVQTAQSEYAAEVNDSINELAAHALLTLHDLLRDPATPHAVRLKTALAILQRPHAPNPGWNLPGTVESEPAETNTGATPISAAPVPAAPPTHPTASAPIARCAPCPVTPDANPRAA